MNGRLMSIALIGLAGLTVGVGTAAGATTAAMASGAPAKRPNVCKPNPDPATPAQVIVTLPHPHAQVSSPVKVKGKINAFEATFQIAIKDASGNDIVSVTAHSHTGQTLSPFKKKVHFTVSASTPACLWVFQFSAQDGTPSMIKQVPITLVP
jgi:hypothetical protein